MPSEAGTPATTPGPSMQQSPHQLQSSAGPTPPQQFCLRWNNYQTNLTNVFDQLLQSESFVDVTLACDGHSVKAHKMVLSACSPYFQALFFDNPCQHPIIIMRDIKWPELKAVVEFMYKGEINVSQEQIGPLLRVAETLKIRGLADVNGDQDLSGPPPPIIPELSAKRNTSLREWDSGGELPSPVIPRVRKRRRQSVERSTASSPTESLLGPDMMESASPAPSSMPSLPVPPPASLPSLPPPDLPLALPLPPPMSHSTHPDDMEIKPGIAEMIREEERAKLLENSHAWLGASTSSIADSYQYQLQSMWQKCWNTNQSLVHNLRFRERGPLKSWRPETMAEAIFSVLKGGLSLSQAARKFDIPYPTFVLYANRVHNMLGPSADGGADLRPKGRGRPQRILLGVWPDEHIRGVIRAVVFRDTHHIKEEAHLGYARLDALSVQNYATGSCSNGPGGAGVHGQDPSVSPGSAAAAAVAAVAQGLRQQMCSMVAAAQHHPDAGSVAGLVGSLSLAGHCGSMMNSHAGLPTGPHSLPHSLRELESRLGSPSESAHDLRMTSPEESPMSSPLGMGLEPALNMTMNQGNGSVELGLGIGISGMAYKHSRGYSPPRPEHLFQEDIADLVGPATASSPPRMGHLSGLDRMTLSGMGGMGAMSGLKDRSPPIKIESLSSGVGECRGE